MIDAALCAHCHLPVQADVARRDLDGEQFRFCCYGCCLAFQVSRGRGEESEAAWLLIRLGVGAFLAMFIMLFSLLLYTGAFDAESGHMVSIVHALLWVLATPVLIILGTPFLFGAWHGASRGRANADTLVCIGVGTAYIYSALQTVNGGTAVYFDTATMVLVLFTVGRYLEAESRARTARDLAPMLAAERATATVVEAGSDRARAASELNPGMVVRIKPGERLPVDGIVIAGRSVCSEAILTGQHEAHARGVGAHVYAGSLNGNGHLLVRVTHAGTDSLWGQIGRFVAEALHRKSLICESVDRIAALFVPAVLILAFATLLYWHRQIGFEAALMAALAVLVVACPCALGLATPLATALGLGQAAQAGVLVRGGDTLERLAGIQGIAFDKTGTLTPGEMPIEHIVTERIAQHSLLQTAAGLAQGSEHPIAISIANTARARTIEPLNIGDIEARPGQGVVGLHRGRVCAMGSVGLMRALGWPIPAGLAQAAEALSGCTQVLVAYDGCVNGLLGLSETRLANSAQVIDSIMQAGLETRLLSGDHAGAVAGMAKALCIDHWQAELSPKGKVDALTQWSSRRGPVAMVGDGLNDGPVLAAASVGIAVGRATDLARETADITLPEGGLRLLPWIIGMARKVRRTIYTNIAWALGYNALALTLAATGRLTPILAAALMAGSSLVVAVNALRTARGSKGGASQGREPPPFLRSSPDQ